MLVFCIDSRERSCKLIIINKKKMNLHAFWQTFLQSLLFLGALVDFRFQLFKAPGLQF